MEVYEKGVNMSIGYACLVVGVPNTSIKRLKKDNISEDKLKEVILFNLHSLENIIDYNIKNNIKLFRISSDIIPFGSSPINNLEWWDIFEKELSDIGKKIRDNSIRVSMHPGQYSVLNSFKKEVVDNTIKDLEYHARFLESLKVDESNKIILHVGGVYNDKQEAKERFINNYNKLSFDIKKRLVIENDDRSFNIKDVLEISNITGAPVIYDNLHNFLNKSTDEFSDYEWIMKCSKTWKENDGKQKIHYSQQEENKKNGSHSKTIYASKFLDFMTSLHNADIDIMLEVKDKNLSATKCINILNSSGKIETLEKEWARYKYSVLEKSSSNYHKIRQLLKDKDKYPVKEFYILIEEALDKKTAKGSAINAIEHVYGYFKKVILEKEKQQYILKLSKFKKDILSLDSFKKYLNKLAIKYNVKYLIESYYFSI